MHGLQLGVAAVDLFERPDGENLPIAVDAVEGSMVVVGQGVGGVMMW